MFQFPLGFALQYHCRKCGNNQDVLPFAIGLIESQQKYKNDLEPKYL